MTEVIKGKYNIYLRDEHHKLVQVQAESHEQGSEWLHFFLDGQPVAAFDLKTVVGFEKNPCKFEEL